MIFIVIDIEIFMVFRKTMIRRLNVISKRLALMRRKEIWMKRHQDSIILQISISIKVMIKKR